MNEELRGAVAKWIHNNTRNSIGSTWGWWSIELTEAADALLAGPLAPLLAKLQAVEALAESPDANSAFGAAVSVHALRRALDAP